MIHSTRNLLQARFSVASTLNCCRMSQHFIYSAHQDITRQVITVATVQQFNSQVTVGHFNNC